MLFFNSDYFGIGIFKCWNGVRWAWVSRLVFYNFCNFFLAGFTPWMHSIGVTVIISCSNCSRIYGSFDKVGSSNVNNSSKIISVFREGG